ncbi:MAG: hypothetical protein A3H73_00085 [Candidatus Taylorbacteria bacterium RIFCSPLOWO2_02_FULL_50_120]|nr:MAG: hypothetical protein UY62_C0047G0008 [Parcubacteria group bacterium GW2011_GWF2_50_9]OHA20586.1 MAG: hypothetical protein A2759_01545 [Candidatus Taylorbacteria bacterium RIFCSPHIGHO2_01_FULL_49_60]OHA36509.1 MAG: hypothetical protein A3B27_03180 [Candidatus Taylorbacteria bacterium RIFCSPLOWO2_01_FULL_50_130]OHA36670.1 MAG: hypothetical protein A2W65_04240 [Candidatus Taylorbacteria bacterium RIFCSPLOWO2_02_50_13]OHA41724.1 MAG: hypothetical protein A3H73_00085 [Candidatus Taylorbacter
MKNTLTAVAVVILVLVAGYFIVKDTSTDSGPETDQSPMKGEVVVSFTDETAAIQNVTEVKMQVESVSLYSNTKGWVEVGSKNVEYRLLELKAKRESRVYATAKVAADTYTRAKIVVKDVTVETKNAGKKTATMPRRDIELVHKTVVKENATASVHIDVLADQSLHATSKGEYIFTPVIKTESRSNASVTVSSNDTVTIASGTVEDMTTLGMDIDGSVKVGFKIDADIKLDISGDTILFPGRTDGAATSSTIIKGVLDSSIDVKIDGAVEEAVDGIIKY